MLEIEVARANGSARDSVVWDDSANKVVGRHVPLPIQLHRRKIFKHFLWWLESPHHMGLR